MDTIYIKLLDSDARIPFVLTYGLHRELLELLSVGQNLYDLPTDNSISDAVLKICLSERNDKGQIISEYDPNTPVELDGVTQLLDYVFEYFSDFFLKAQEKKMGLSQKLTKISAQ